MDPDACVRRINSAFARGDYHEAKAACADLADWLSTGGFPPSVALDIRAQVWALRRVAGNPVDDAASVAYSPSESATVSATPSVSAYVQEKNFRAGFRAGEVACLKANPGILLDVNAEGDALADFVVDSERRTR